MPGRNNRLTTMKLKKAEEDATVADSSVVDSSSRQFFKRPASTRLCSEPTSRLLTKIVPVTNPTPEARWHHLVASLKLLGPALCKRFSRRNKGSEQDYG